MRRIAVTTVALLAGVAVVAFFAARTTGPGAGQTPSAVDVGFAQDMAVHHQQAVVMAAYTREHAGSDAVQDLAGSIDSAQQREIGQMVGWLQSWGKPQQSDRLPMSWMEGDQEHHERHDLAAGSMPGMATPAEMDRLVNLTGQRLDVQFLKLMVRHHEGGLPMARYAANRAEVPYVRDAARVMIQDQQREIDQMRILLESLER